jgi:hypothetical protein
LQFVVSPGWLFVKRQFKWVGFVGNGIYARGSIPLDLACPCNFGRLFSVQIHGSP